MSGGRDGSGLPPGHCNITGHFTGVKVSTFTGPNTTTQGSLSLAALWPSSACLEILGTSQPPSSSVSHYRRQLWEMVAYSTACRGKAVTSRMRQVPLLPGLEQCCCHPLPRRVGPSKHSSPVTYLEASRQTHCLAWKGIPLCARYLSREAETTYQAIELNGRTEIYSGFPKTVFIFPFCFDSDSPPPPVKIRRFPQISGPQGSLARVTIVTKLQVARRSGSRPIAHIQICS